MANIKDVAKLAGVGIGTVSRVINNNGSVKPSTRSRVEWAIKQLNYTPNEVARNFKKQTTKLVGLMVPTIFHPYFSELAYYVENELYKYNYKLLICNSEAQKEKELQYVEMLKMNQVAGIIVISYNDFYSNMDIDFPIVTIDRYISGKIPHVTADNYKGGLLATKALIKGGCKNIAYVGGGSTIQTSVSLRKKAFIDVAKQNNVKYHVLEEVLNLNQEHKLIKKLFEKYPDVDGVFTSTDYFAAELIKEAKNLGIHVPSDLQVIGFDGIQKNDLFHPLLSTIKQPVEEIARVSVKILLDIIMNKKVPKETVLDVQYLDRETTK